MAEQPSRSLTDIEQEAATSYREWPIYIVMRLKRLQAIQEKLRVGGDTPSAMIRREELLKAVYDQDSPPQGVAEGEQPQAAADEGAASDYIAYDDPPAAQARPPSRAKAGKASAAVPKSKAKPKAGAASGDDSGYMDDVNYDE